MRRIFCNGFINIISRLLGKLCYSASVKELQPITEQAYRYYDARTEREQPRFYQEDTKRDEERIDDIRVQLNTMRGNTTVIHNHEEKSKLKEPKKLTLAEIIALFLEILIKTGKAIFNPRSTKNLQ